MSIYIQQSSVCFIVFPCGIKRRVYLCCECYVAECQPLKCLSVCVALFKRTPLRMNRSTSFPIVLFCNLRTLGCSSGLESDKTLLSNPRKSTQSVSVSAVSGNTFFFEVEGWCWGENWTN